MPLNFLKGFGLVQEKYDFLGAERFDAEHVAEAKWHNVPRKSGPDLSHLGPGSGNAFDEHDALFLIDFIQADFDDLGVAGLHGAADK